MAVYYAKHNRQPFFVSELTGKKRYVSDKMN